MSLCIWFSAKAIDEYANLKSKVAESNAEAANVDPMLEAIVESMLNKYAKLYGHEDIDELRNY